MPTAARAIAVALEVRIVDVRDTVTIGVTIFTIVRVVREGIRAVILTITIGVCITWQRTLLVLLEVGHAIPVGVLRRITW